MPTVTCELIDCAEHSGRYCKGNVKIDKFGEIVCYDPKPMSALIHDQFNRMCKGKTKHGRHIIGWLR